MFYVKSKENGISAKFKYNFWWCLPEMKAALNNISSNVQVSLRDSQEIPCGILQFSVHFILARPALSAFEVTKTLQAQC